MDLIEDGRKSGGEPGRRRQDKDQGEEEEGGKGKLNGSRDSQTCCRVEGISRI